jgi:hypothetical protein
MKLLHALTYHVIHHIFVYTSLQLYAQVEKSGFRNTADLIRTLRCFLRAAVEGVNKEEATEWIASFLDSTSALPPSTVAALPPSLLRLLQWVAGSTREEREVYRQQPLALVHV